MPNTNASTAERNAPAAPSLETELQALPIAVAQKRDWLRIPDVTRLFGIGRSTTYELISEGKIKSACLRKKGNVQGIRLVFAPSLEIYLDSIATGGEEAASK